MPATILIVDAAATPDPTTFNTIADALTAATTTYAGDAEIDIQVVAGTYAEDLSIGRTGVSILGANAGIAHDGARGAETVIDGVIDVTASGDGTVIDGVTVKDGGTVLGQKTGIYVAADDVSIANSLFDGPGTSSGFFGIVTPINTTNRLSVTDNGFTGWHAGIYLNNGAADVTVTGNGFDGNLVGMSLDFPVTGDVSGNDFTDAGLEHIGIGYADGIDAGATVGANSFDDSAHEVTLYGDAATGTANDDVFFASAGNDSYDGGDGADLIDMGAAGAGGAFVDLNSGLAFSTQTGIDSLTSFENVKGSAGNDGLYGNAGDNVFFASGGDDIIDGRGGSDTFDASAASGDVTADLEAGTVSGAYSATLTSVENIVTDAGDDAVTGSTADNTIATGAGDDTITASAGTDAIDGGDGMDAVVFSGDIDTYTLDLTAGTVTKGADVTTYTNVEKLIFDDSTVFFLSPSDSIQAAVDAADPHDIIVLDDASYTENVTINKPLTILGANAGIEADGARGPETVLTGSFQIGSGGAGTTIDGLSIADGAPVLGEYAGIHIGADDVSIMNNIMTGSGVDANAPDAYRGILSAWGGAANLLIDGNSFAGWDSGIYLNPGATATVTNNLFDGNGNAINNDGPDAVDISGNDFQNSTGAHTAFGVLDPGTTDLGAVVDSNTFDGGSTPVSIYVLGAADRTVIGTDNADVFVNDWKGGGDSDLSGGLGDDTFVYSAGSQFSANEVIDGGDGTDTIRFSSTSDGDTLTLTSNVTNVEAVDLTGTANLDVDASGVGNGLDITGNDGMNAITGTAFADTIDAGAGDDTITGGAGDDDIDGGDGTDTAVYSDDATVYVMDGGWSVGSTADGDDVLSNVEVVDTNGAGGAQTYLVGLDGLGTIAEALALAGDGDTILLAEGTYSEDFDITQDNLTIKGVGDGAQVIIEGTGSGRGIEVMADDVTIENLSVQKFNYGIEVGDGSDDLTISDVHISDSNIGIRKATASVVNDLTIEGGSIEGANFGIYMAKASSGGRLDGLTVDGTAFDTILKKGIYLETGDNVDIKHVTMDDVAGDTGKSTGISINLIHDDGTPYQNLSIDDFTFNNVGDANGAGISVKVQSTASVTGDVTISNGTIDGTTVGIRAGDPGGSGPDVVVTGVEVTNATIADGDNLTDGTLKVTMLDGGDTWTTAPSTTGDVEITGGDGADSIMTGGGDDTIDGSTGNDAIDGGAGTDTAVYSDAATITNDGTSWSVSSAAGGTDALSNIEIVDDSGAGQTFLVGLDGLGTVAEALALAGDGDTILLAEGIYSGEFDVTQDNLTIKGVGDGANVIIDGTGTGRGIEVDADGVTIENLSIQEFRYGIEVEDGADDLTVKDVHISDSDVGVKKPSTAVVNDLTIDGGSMSTVDTGIYIAKNSSTGRLDGLTVDGTDFSDVVKKGIYLETGDNVDIKNVTMDTVGVTDPKGTGISVNLIHDEGTPYHDMSISDFAFTDVGNGAGAGISIKVQDSNASYAGYANDPATFTGIVTISDGTIDGTTVGINAGEPGLAGPRVSVDNVDVTNASVSDGNNVTGSTMTVTMLDGGDEWRMAAATTGDVNVTGGDGNDTVSGGDGNDTLLGGTGDDLFIGSGGQDIMIGGADDDTVSYEDSDAAVNVNLLTGVLTGGYAQGDVVSGIENVTGSGFGDALTGNAEANRLSGGDGDDALAGGVGDDLLLGDGGNDTLDGGFGNDTLDGGDGNDVMDGGAGVDWMFGGAGTDMLSGGASNDTLDGGTGTDLLYGNAGDDYLYGGDGVFADTLYGDKGNDTLDGGLGDDYLDGGVQDDLLYGRSGDDVMLGNWGNDTMIGGAGDDTLDGGGGDDVLSGGANLDTFVFDTGPTGNDTITDFTNWKDKIDISAFGLSDYGDLTAAGAVSSVNGDSSLIDLSAVGGNGTILLDGFDFANLDGFDFIF